MKTVIKLSFVLAALTLYACSSHEKENVSANSESAFNGLDKAAWLIGRWQNNSNEGNATETWQKENDSTYSATSYFVVGKDTVSSEKIKLVQNGKDVFYVPTVKNQNNGQPVKFKMTSNTTDLLIFENPEHDFPQKISYAKISDNSLMAEISGVMDGKENAQKFPMTRVK